MNTKISYVQFLTALRENNLTTTYINSVDLSGDYVAVEWCSRGSTGSSCYDTAEDQGGYDCSERDEEIPFAKILNIIQPNVEINKYEISDFLYENKVLFSGTV